MKSIHILIQNNYVIKLVNNPTFDGRTKGINTKQHLILYHVEAKNIHLRNCSTTEKIEDIFTKSPIREKNENLLMMLGLTNTNWKGENVR